MTMLKKVQAGKVLKALNLGEIETGRGLNQEIGLSRPGDTRWSSHFNSILSLISLYPSTIEVLEDIGSSSKCVDDRAKAQIALDHLESFEFIFMLYLMKVIFGYTNDLCQALQRKDQDIVNAMTLVDLTMAQLQHMRDDGWDNFLETVCNFCVKNKVEVPNMSDFYAPLGRSRRCLHKVVNLHRYRVEIYTCVIDKQVEELKSRFDEKSKELLKCMACLSPENVFASFNKLKLVNLTEFYPKDFTTVDIMRLGDQLDIYYRDMKNDSSFHNLKNLGELSVKLVETRKHIVYNWVYLLIKLALILPVATASVERVFSSMKFVKNKMRNRIGDKLLNHCLVTFIERDYFVRVSDDDIIKRYQNMKSRRMVLD
ncbi:uncharacterized protein LOC141619769 [Silene latifolia]|uniref:uncharacterized protein LOC141619769 n=1 Tax=Silene latifolia TaxID=37657 RepID=UPI003D786A61